MVIFHSYVNVPEGNLRCLKLMWNKSHTNPQKGTFAKPCSWWLSDREASAMHRLIHYLVVVRDDLTWINRVLTTKKNGNTADQWCLMSVFFWVISYHARILGIIIINELGNTINQPAGCRCFWWMLMDVKLFGHCLKRTFWQLHGRILVASQVRSMLDCLVVSKCVQWLSVPISWRHSINCTPYFSICWTRDSNPLYS